jgi:protein SCO1/2
MALMVAATLVLAACAGVLLFARDGTDTSGAGSAFAGSVRPAIPPQDFALHDQDGRLVRLSDYRGQVVVLTFLYSTCQDTCPVTASQIRGALDDLGKDVPALAISVDPVNDTPLSAKRFLLNRKLSGGRMRFLLGTRAQLQPVWDAYGISPQGDKADDGAFEHSAYVLLVDARGRQRVSFPFDKLTPEGLAADIRRLQRQA